MPITGHPPNTTYRTIALEDFGVFMCGAQEGCPKGLGWRAHRYGRVDRAGTIHWNGAETRASKRGMRHLMKLLALAHHREWWTEPAWMKLFLTNVWTTRTTAQRYHYRVRASWSYKDREEALRLARKSRRRKGSLRHNYRNFYAWVIRVGLSGAVVHYPSQEGVQPPV